MPDQPTKPKHVPPKRKQGKGLGPRSISGALLDVRGVSRLYGGTEKQTRGLVARGLIPHRRLGGRIVFPRAELEQWLASLPGVTLAEASENREKRYAEK